MNKKNTKLSHPQQPQRFYSVILDHDNGSFQVILDPFDEIFAFFRAVRERTTRNVTHERVRIASKTTAELRGVGFRHDRRLKRRLQDALDRQSVVEALCS
ncbi:MAG TPA: hypothetical protein VE031_08080 [Chthoniobacterales bacterium]|nr:hypothetical protein [Chthoniobacterales bacterium]